MEHKLKRQILVSGAWYSFSHKQTRETLLHHQRYAVWLAGRCQFLLRYKMIKVSEQMQMQMQKKKSPLLYLSTQWAAVITQSSFIRLPPQVWTHASPDPNWTDTWTRKDTEFLESHYLNYSKIRLCIKPIPWGSGTNIVNCFLVKQPSSLFLPATARSGEWQHILQQLCRESPPSTWVEAPNQPTLMEKKIQKKRQR